MSVFIRCDAPSIIDKTIQRFKVIQDLPNMKPDSKKK